MSSSRQRAVVVAIVMFVTIGLMGSTEADAGIGWFTGLSIGQSGFDGYELEDIAESLDDSDTAFMAYGGYQFTRNVGVVGGYVDLGELNASATGGEIDFTDKIEASGFFTAALGILPINKRFSFFATAGIIRWDQDVSWTEYGGEYTWTGGDTGTSAMYGVGFNAFVTGRQNVGLHVEWTRFNKIGNTDVEISGHENDIDLLSVGFIYRFGI